jgi:hypothetical protein
MYGAPALLSITADGYLSAACTVAVLAYGTFTAYRSAQHKRMESKEKEQDQRLDQQNEHLTRHDRKFQTLRDKHGLDTTITD